MSLPTKTSFSFATFHEEHHHKTEQDATVCSWEETARCEPDCVCEPIRDPESFYNLRVDGYRITTAVNEAVIVAVK